MDVYIELTYWVVLLHFTQSTYMRAHAHAFICGSVPFDHDSDWP